MRAATAMMRVARPGVAAKASRTITIEMSDKMRFTPSDLVV